MPVSAQRSLPGLHGGKVHQWTEDWALLLLEGVDLSPTSNEAVAEWLNAFLSHLHDTNSLTPAILDRASNLPLLPVRVPRTSAHIRVSAREWVAAAEVSRLFALSDLTAHWLRFLLAALPDWSCLVGYCSPPRWFTGHYSPALDARTAATAVLSQSRLGQFPARAELVRHFASQPGLPDALRLDVRYLLHGHVSQARDDEHFLFMPSSQPGKQIWSRLIEPLLIHEGGENSWRLLPHPWASVLSPQVQKDLTVSTIDEQGAWEELMTARTDFSTLDFPVKEWSATDVATLLHGLFRAGHPDPGGTVALLGRLRLHTLRGHPRRGWALRSGTVQ